ncbi:hypothetical protein NIES4103_52060 [Nostoc sp. NIES-4103]|nr:hypothetical protein NIES4103_52060 [Nostoc sp. NIES-4103]
MQLSKLFKTLGLTAFIVAVSQTTSLFIQNKVLAEAGSNKLLVNETLQINQYLLSSDGIYKFILQSDGNLVLYRTDYGIALWNSGTVGRAVNYAIQQSDGNFVIYGPQGAVWSTRTQGNYGAFLQVQNDGNVVIYKPTAVWQTGTSGK